MCFGISESDTRRRFSRLDVMSVVSSGRSSSTRSSGPPPSTSIRETARVGTGLPSGPIGAGSPRACGAIWTRIVRPARSPPLATSVTASSRRENSPGCPGVARSA